MLFEFLIVTPSSSISPAATVVGPSTDMSTFFEEMKLDQVLTVPTDIDQVERHKVGLRPEDRLTVRDLLNGMLIASGNDCAEVLARA